VSAAARALSGGSGRRRRRRPLNDCYLQSGHLPKLQTAVAAGALDAKTGKNADAIVRSLVFMKSPFARPGALRDGASVYDSAYGVTPT